MTWLRYTPSLTDTAVPDMLTVVSVAAITVLSCKTPFLSMNESVLEGTNLCPNLTMRVVTLF